QGAMNRWLNGAPKQLEMVGQRVAIFTEKLEEDEWTYYVCHPRPNILIWATSQPYLKEVLERIEKPGPRALPDNLPEWKQVDTTAPIWAIRHYTNDYSASDPSSPSREKAAANVPDPQALGFVFWWDANAKNAAHACYLTKGKDGQKVVGEGWTHPTEKLTP